MQEIEPNEFDCIVVGTGLVESIVAAAAAKAGKTVLQVDPAEHYGGAWAALHLDEFLAAVEASRADSEDTHTSMHGDIQARMRGGCILRCPGTQLGPSSAFNIDVSPHLLYGAGPMISLLLGSGAHHYTEYKLLQGIYLAGEDGSLQAVPSTRAEVFRDRALTPLQKRVLMRFLKGSTDAMQGQGPLKDAFDDRPLVDLLSTQGLDADLQKCLVHGVLLQPCLDARLSAAEGLHFLRLYAESVGRYGPDAGPFLTPMYGCGELPQAFCRAAAVSGAVQILRCGVLGLEFDEHTFECTGIEMESGQKIRCGHLAAGVGALGEWIETFKVDVKKGVVHRCVAVLDAPLVADKQQALVVVPGVGPDGRAVWALQLGHSTSVCPPGKWLLHLWTQIDIDDEEEEVAINSTASSVLMPALEQLVDCSRLEVANGIAGQTVEEEASLENNPESAQSSHPSALLAAFFSLDTVEMAQMPPSGSWPHNVVLCPGPSGAVSMAGVVDAAKACYWALFPSNGEPHADAEDGENVDSTTDGGIIQQQHHFPLDPAPVGGGGGYDSDEEAVQALQAALLLGAVDDTAVGEEAASDST